MCSKHCKLRELVKRSYYKVFYNFIIKYTDIFVKKMEAFHIFQQKILAYLKS